MYIERLLCSELGSEGTVWEEVYKPEEKNQQHSSNSTQQSLEASCGLRGPSEDIMERSHSVTLYFVFVNAEFSVEPI